MNTPVDPALLQLVQHHVNTLKTDVDKLTFDMDDERGAVKKALHDVEAHLKELENRVERVEEGVKDLQDEQIILQQRVTQVEEQVKAAIPRISSGQPSIPTASASNDIGLSTTPLQSSSKDRKLGTEGETLVAVGHHASTATNEATPTVNDVVKALTQPEECENTVVTTTNNNKDRTSISETSESTSKLDNEACPRSSVRELLPSHVSSSWTGMSDLDGGRKVDQQRESEERNLRGGQRDLREASTGGRKCTPRPRGVERRDTFYEKGSVLDAEENRELEFKSLVNAQPSSLPWKIMEKAKKFICACLNAGNRGTIYFGVGDSLEKGSKYQHGEILGLDVENIRDDINKAFQFVLDDHIRSDNGPLEKGGEQNCVSIHFVPVKIQGNRSSLYVIEIEVARDWRFCKERIYYSKSWTEKRCGDKDSTGKKALSDFFKVKDEYDDVAIRTNGASCCLKQVEVDRQVKKPLEARYKEFKRKTKYGGNEVTEEISSCEADIAFFAERHDADTRQWLFDDFNNWFRDPGDSRAYVLLGDAGVGKSVMAGALAQRTREAGQLGAAYFCRHNDGTRNDPRYLLGTVACQLIECKSDYSNIVGGEGGVRLMLANSKLGVLELFTKLLQEPLAKCTHCERRKLVIIDALDETEYQSRGDFLDLLMHWFPLLPRWLVFFITSRPEDTVQFRLKKYNPCIKICAGDGEHLDFYQQHERDIRRFLEKRLDISCLPYSLEDITAKCNGLFLYAYYIVEVLNDPVHSGKIGDLNDIFPGEIDDFFRENFKRVFNKVGADLYRKLFGCVIAAPSPLPLSFISFILKRENSDLDEQEVIDVVSQFVVLRTSDETFTFLHSLIPSWLTDKKKASRILLIDRIKAGEYLRDIILGLLPSVVDDKSIRLPSVESGLADYVLRVGVRVLCGYNEKYSTDTVFSCLTSYQFIQKRIQSSRSEIYSVVSDFKLSVCCEAIGDAEKEILQDICTALESDIHVLVECPHLLPSCLRNASNDVQRQFALPDADISVTWKKFNWVPNPLCEILKNIRCFALSPDKKLLAGLREQSLYLFDACSLKKVHGPVKIVENFSPKYLEFSPDGKFVFFGRLDRCFSVERGCIEGLSHFSRNSRVYGWGFCTADGYVVVKKDDLISFGRHRIGCIVNVLCLWAVQELLQVHGKGLISSSDPRQNVFYLEFDQCAKAFREFGNILINFRLISLNSFMHRLRVLKYWIEICPPCDDCCMFEHEHQQPTLALARQRITDLYSDIFEFQVWNVQSGKNIFEEVFNADVQLSRFFYLCHLVTPLERCGELLGDLNGDFSLWYLALVNACGCLFQLPSDVPYLRQSRFSFTEPMAPTAALYSSSFLYTVLYSSPFLDTVSHSSFFLNSVPTKFFNHLFAGNLRQSLDGEWIAVRVGVLPNCNALKVGHDSLAFFKHKSQHHKLFDSREAVHVIKDVKKFAFTYDSRHRNAVVYVTEDGSFHALSLETGNILSSISVLWDLAKKQVGYAFFSKNEEINVYHDSSDFSIGIFNDFLISSPKPSNWTPVGVSFTLQGSILSLASDSTLVVFKTDHDGSVTGMMKLSLEYPSNQGSRVSCVEKCAFSKEGNLIATNQGNELLMFYESSLLSAVLEKSEEDQSCVSCLMFSADSSLLLYCIEKRNGCAHVYFWDVHKRQLSSSFAALLSVNCCWLLSDNSKLVICGDLRAEIWERCECSWRLSGQVELSWPYRVFEKFSHCTVSSNNELLACCIADGVHLYPLCVPTRQSFRQLPHGHLGRIEFCQFLKGSRYLISYGVDGVVFLWDLCEWKAVAYARIVQRLEFITSMAVSPDEDKAVCLTSLNRFLIIKLRGLKSGTMPLEFLSLGMTGSQGFTCGTSRGQLPEQGVPVLKSGKVSNDESIAEDTNIIQLLEEMDFVLPSEDSEDGDEDESDEMLTD